MPEFVLFLQICVQAFHLDDTVPLDADSDCVIPANTQPVSIDIVLVILVPSELYHLAETRSRPGLCRMSRTEAAMTFFVLSHIRQVDLSSESEVLSKRDSMASHPYD